jgi:2-(1,2-epoxy-1,2-dihydrophenyl)acetyl-CoA isomerase
MADFGTYGDVHVDLAADFVATAEVRRPPNNFFDLEMIDSLCEAFEALDASAGCRAIVLCAEGKHFCAGANFGSRTPIGADPRPSDGPPRHLYDAAVRLFRTRTPIVAAVQGAAIGGGLGLSLMTDFRVAAPEARFSANFAQLGFHHGFGLTVTLPALVGQQKAMELLYTGVRVAGEEAQAIGLCDRLVPLERLRDEAHSFAAQIATSAPLAVDSIRETLRGDLADRIRVATDRERSEQDRLQKTADFKEGIKASGQRRKPEFKGE